MCEHHYPVTETLVISKEHPSLAGHFPGDPIVPGVVILDRIIQLWQNKSQKQIKQIINTKFLSLLRADKVCTVQYVEKKDNKVEFSVIYTNEHTSNHTIDTTSDDKKTVHTLICKGLFSYDG